MANSNQNNPQTIIIPLGSVAAADELPGGYYPKAFKLTSVHLMNAADMSASDTNYVQVSLQTGATVIAEVDTRAAHEGALTANTAKACNLVDAQSKVAAGSSLKVVYAEGGTIALDNACLVLNGYYL